MARNLEINQQLELTSNLPFTTLRDLDLTVANDGTAAVSALVAPEYKFDLSTTVADLARDLRNSFTNGMANVCESYVSKRLQAKLRNIARFGREEVGHSNFLFSRYGETLNGFEFNREYPFENVFQSKYFIKGGSNRGHLILHFPAFIPKESLSAPAGATHFKLYSQLVALSDFEFDEEEGFHPVNKKLHGKKSEFYSQMLPILKIPVQPITSQLSVNNGMGVPDSSGLLLIMGVHFYHYEDGKFEPMSKESSLDIVKVY